MRRGIAVLMAVVTAFCLLTGCRKENGPTGPDPAAGIYQVYYAGTGYRLVTDLVEAGTGEAADVAQTLLERMRHPRPDLEGASAIPADVMVNGVTVENDLLQVAFDSGYREITPERELICRAAVVQTLTQIPQVDRVDFQVDGQRLTDASGRPIGPFDAEDFVNVSGQDVNMNTEAVLTVYFAMADSPFLIGESRQVTYSGLSSVGEYLMESLIAGPSDESLRPVIAEGTRVLDLTVRGGVCYLNLHPGEQLPEGVSAEMSLYAIVDSLTTIANITSVQLLIDSAQDAKYFGISVKDAFTHNLDLIAP